MAILPQSCFVVLKASGSGVTFLELENMAEPATYWTCRRMVGLMSEIWSTNSWEMLLVIVRERWYGSKSWILGIPGIVKVHRPGDMPKGNLSVASCGLLRLRV